MSSGWESVRNHVKLSATDPFEIKTYASLVNEEQVSITFKNQHGTGYGAMKIKFGSTIRITLDSYCQEWKELNLPETSEQERIWTVHKTVESLTVTCDEVVVYNLVYAHHPSGSCGATWARDTQYFSFLNNDRASREWRVKPRGNVPCCPLNPFL